MLRSYSTQERIPQPLSRLPDFASSVKVPRSVVFAEALPRNAVGKVHKPTLRQWFADAVR